MNINDPIISKIESITNTVLTSWQKQQIANAFESIQSDAIESTVRKCADVASKVTPTEGGTLTKHNIVEAILSLITQKEWKV